MKKRSNYLFILTLSFVMLFASCNADKLNSKAEESAISFYNNLKKKDYLAALSLCSNKAFEADTKEEWTKALKRNTGLLGDLKSFTKTSGFNIATSIATGTTVTILYDVQWQYGKSKDSVVLIKEKDGSMKLYRYAWEHRNARYMAELGESEKITHRYMDAVKAGNFDAATALCSEDALKATPKKNWESFLDNAANKLGAISGYSIIRDSSAYHIDAKGECGEGNYYDIYVQSERGNNKVKEKIVFFQKNYDKPVKLTGHYFL